MVEFTLVQKLMVIVCFGLALATFLAGIWSSYNSWREVDNTKSDDSLSEWVVILVGATAAAGVFIACGLLTSLLSLIPGGEVVTGNELLLCSLIIGVGLLGWLVARKAGSEMFGCIVFPMALIISLGILIF